MLDLDFLHVRGPRREHGRLTGCRRSGAACEDRLAVSRCKDTVAGMTRRPPGLYRGFALSALFVVLAGCSNAGPTPDALEDPALPPGVTTTQVPGAPGSNTATSVSVIAAIPLTEETSAEARTRIETTGEMREADMRFGLMNEDEYNSLAAPQTGEAAVVLEGPINPAAFPQSRTASLGVLNGFAREWISEDQNYTIREELTYLESSSEASTYAKRLVAELQSHGIAKGSHSAPNVVFVAEFGVKEAKTKRPCNSVAVARRDRLVAVSIISNLCTVSTGPWAEVIAANQLERVQNSLGL